MKRFIRNASLLVMLFFLFPSAGAFAQDKPTLKEVLGSGSEPKEPAEAADPEQAAETEKATETERAKAPPPPAGPLDDFNRGVPRTSVEGFVAAARERDWERAAEYLDLRNLRRGMDASRGPELARELKIVLDRTLWIDVATLSESPDGHQEDGLPSYRDRLGVIETPEGKIDVLLQRVPRDDGVFIWKLSNRTVTEIPTLFEHHGYGPVVEELTRILPEFEFLGLELWQWVGMIGMGLASYLVAWALTSVLGALILRAGRPSRERVARFVRGPLRFLLLVLLFSESVDALAPSLAVLAVLDAIPVVVLAVAWTLVRAADLFFDGLFQRLEQERSGSSVLVRPVRTATRVVIILAAGMTWLDNVGFDVTTLLAGLGVGGVAVALAAQKSLEDILGAVTIFAGRPVRVGDFCRFGDKLGTVEEIGLRWTRVRTLDHSVVHVSNAEFAKQNLENLTMRRKIWYHPRLRLRYETTPDQLRYILVEVRKLLYSHPRVLPDPARIRFVGFGEHSLDLEIFSYIDTQDYGEFLEIAEDLNLQTMEIVTRAGSGFALPSQTTYLESGSGLDAERAGEAEACVNRWRDQKELYLPTFPEDKVAELRGSIPYPPVGAPASTSSA